MRAQRVRGPVLRRRHARMFTEFPDQMRLIGITRRNCKPRKIARTFLCQSVQNAPKPLDAIVAAGRKPHGGMKHIDEMPRAQADLAPDIIDTDMRAPGLHQSMRHRRMYKQGPPDLRQR